MSLPESGPRPEIDTYFYDLRSNSLHLMAICIALVGYLWLFIVIWPETGAITNWMS